MLGFDVSIDEWRVVQTARPNLLVIGSDDGLSKFLNVLLATVDLPVEHWTAQAATLPTTALGTVIVPAIDRLGDTDQRRLSAWLDRRGERTQLVSTANRALYPLVESGHFLDRLYYRLNVVTLMVGGPDS